VEKPSTAVPCSAWVGELTWTAEPPRASGVWWWWSGDVRLKAECVEIRKDIVTDTLYGSPTMIWHGLTRVRVCDRVGGWWAGPVESPKLPDAQSSPTDPS